MAEKMSNLVYRFNLISLAHKGIMHFMHTSASIFLQTQAMNYDDDD